MKKLEFSDEQKQIFKECVKHNETRYSIAKKLNVSTDTVRTLARYEGVKYLQEHYEFSSESKLKIRELYETTDLSVNKIEKILKHRDVMGYIIDTYSKEYRDNRHKILLSKQKIGNQNPMKNKYGLQHPNYKGIISDGKGYLMILKPDWYTGRKGCKHIYYHHYVWCINMGITEIPKGYVIHHIDLDKTNNDIENLALMTVSAHSKLHQMLNKLQNSKI